MKSLLLAALLLIVANLVNSGGHGMCGSGDIEDSMEITRGRGLGRSFTEIHHMALWDNGEIPWSFVSNGDEYAEQGFVIDDRFGLSKLDVDTIQKAIENIENDTCIRFKLTDKPDTSKPWLAIYREAKMVNGEWECLLEESESMGTDICNTKNGRCYGDIYQTLKRRYQRRFDGTWCFGGAFAGYGEGYPQKMVLSQTSPRPYYISDVGLMIHELLHNLGLGHTQKRRDARLHIRVLEDNIDPPHYKSQFEPSQSSYYDTHGIPYDCSSIMHYGPYAFNKPGTKTIVAIDPDNCKIAYNNRLTENDIALINKMYKCKSTMAPTETVNATLAPTTGETTEPPTETATTTSALTTGPNTDNPICRTTHGEICVFPFSWFWSNYDTCVKFPFIGALCRTESDNYGRCEKSCPGA